jgi:hypothetical protein
MRRAALLATVLTIAALPAAQAGSSGRGPASVRIADCRLSEGAESRRATFEGAMRALPGTRRMSMRFRLLERVGEGVFQRLEAEGLDVWRRSRAGVRRFVYHQDVAGLKADADYRVDVQFKWVNAAGETIRLTRRRSPACEQASSLPNLTIRSVESRPGGSPDTAVYTVSVRNGGASEVHDLGVGLTVDGVALADARVGALKPLEVATVEFTGPVCTEGATAVADPQNTVRETSEHDNVRAVRCPLP